MTHTILKYAHYSLSVCCIQVYGPLPFVEKNTYLTVGTYIHRRPNLLILRLTVSCSHRNVAGQQACSLHNLHLHMQFFFNNSSPVKGWNQFSNFAMSSFTRP